MSTQYNLFSPSAPSKRLSLDDAVQIWEMKRLGWLQSRIAAHFDVNQGRVSEILNGKNFPEAQFKN